ncbi:MAG: alpha-galactosidase [Butyrivibrio sp.]|nr:alpha-galactosidase [Butyrivibrio sp.]
MKNAKIIRESVNGMEAVYMIAKSGQVSFTIIPARAGKLFFDIINPDPLVQISCTGDATSIGFAAGETRHNSAMTMAMKYVSQDVRQSSKGKVIITTVEGVQGIRVRHVVIAPHNCRGVRVYTDVCNQSDFDITLEAISSVNISGITPYTDDVGRDRLMLHRFRSRWSAEGRHEVRSIEDLLLEPSWANFGVRCEKFGSVGSMPVRGYFPFAAVEDKEVGVIWGLSCACSSSWQIEAVRIDKRLSISAGLADYEFGHWRKTLKSGDEFVTPEVYVTAGRCDFAGICDRLLDVQRDKLLREQRVTSLPAIFNEYCTTWGKPSEKVIGRLLNVINGKDFEYFVIDAGWYADFVKGWQDNMGEWDVALDLFPDGIKKAVDMIEDAGMKAGIWFELEVVGAVSDMANDTAHLLTRDGKVIISGTRRFWDMRSEWVTEYLSKKVIDFLNENGFKYIKIDYNDTIGIGCDGAESPGEGLRACVNATKDFYRRIRDNVPDIAIEVCSSGGHRLEPGFMELADYVSFSDAHEEKEIPVIAADLQNLVLTQKSQIWAVLRKDDELKRIAYSVCAGMYGVLCISGDVCDLAADKWQFALNGVSFYKKVSPIIITGRTERFGHFQNSNRELKDYQATVRYGRDGKALVIVHSFDHEGTQKITIPLMGEFRIADKFETGDHKVTIAGSELTMEFEETFDALALLLDCD